MSLTVEAVRAGYGELEILQGVSLHVAPGRIVGLIGPNGAGKSTLLKTVFGYLRPIAGRVEFDGHDLVGRRPEVEQHHRHEHEVAADSEELAVGHVDDVQDAEDQADADRDQGIEAPQDHALHQEVGQ